MVVRGCVKAAISTIRSGGAAARLLACTHLAVYLIDGALESVSICRYLMMLIVLQSHASSSHHG
jgi:hypothetical protein